MNNITLIGRLTKDVELKTTQNGKSRATFTLAVDRGYKDSNNKMITDFIPCVAYEGRAETIAKYVFQGYRFAVTGSMRIDKYTDQQGQNKSYTYVAVDGFDFIESKKQENPQPVVEEGGFIACDNVDDENLPFN